MIGLMNWRGLLEFRPTIERREAQYQRMLSDKDQQIAKADKAADDWKAAFESSQEGKRELWKQNGDLMRMAEIATTSMEVIRDNKLGRMQGPSKSGRTADRG